MVIITFGWNRSIFDVVLDSRADHSGPLEPDEDVNAEGKFGFPQSLEKN
jgi:hypothetical protein